MNVEETLRVSLQSTPKYIPVWYLYDKVGSAARETWMKGNDYYYTYRQEMFLLKEHIRVTRLPAHRITMPP